MKKKDREIWNGQYDKDRKVIQERDIESNCEIIPTISIEEDLDNIGEDTDEILRQLIKTLNSSQDNKKHTLSTKRWVISLFILDKFINIGLMFLTILLAMKYGIGII